MTNVRTPLKIAALAVVAAAAAVLLTLSVSATPAHANVDASLKPLKSGTLQLSYVPGKKMLNSVSFWGEPKQKVTNVKSSNKSVVAVSVKREPNLKNYIVTLKLKKPGTAKITCKVNGKKYAVKVKVRKYEPAIKSLKVGKLDMAEELKTKALVRTVGGCYGLMAFGSKTNKVTVEAADGWKVNKIYTLNYVKGKNVMKKYKNGGKVKGSFIIQMKDKKTGFTEDYSVQIPEF